jgi:hypothetical protein
MAKKIIQKHTTCHIASRELGPFTESKRRPPLLSGGLGHLNCFANRKHAWNTSDQNTKCAPICT